jgi:hypothetical protein
MGLSNHQLAENAIGHKSHFSPILIPASVFKYDQFSTLQTHKIVQNTIRSFRFFPGFLWQWVNQILKTIRLLSRPRTTNKTLKAPFLVHYCYVWLFLGLHMNYGKRWAFFLWHVVTLLSSSSSRKILYPSGGWPQPRTDQNEKREGDPEEQKGMHDGGEW